jgi:hypothetical protein
MGVVNTTYTFTSTDTITSAKMNNIIDETTFTGDAIQGTTLQVVSPGKLAVSAGGITSNELASNSVVAAKIANGAVITEKIFDSAITTIKLADSTSSTTGVTTAKIADSNVTTVKLADASVVAEKLNGAQTGSAPIYGIRAWVNFNAQSTANVGGTYTRTASTTVTVDTSSDHGLIVGNAVYLDFTVGTGTAPFDGLYVVASVVDSNTFTVVSSVGTTSTGTVSLSRKTIRASGNVANVSAAYSGATIASPPTSSKAVGVGFYVVNFMVAMPDSDFSISGACNELSVSDANSGNKILAGFAPNEKCAFISSISTGSNPINCVHTSVQVIR